MSKHKLFPQFIFFKSTIILCKYTIISPKTNKMCDSPQIKFQIFRIELLTIPGKIGRLFPPIGSKQLPRTLRNCSLLYKNRQSFRKRGVSLHKTKFSGKPRIFQGERLMPSQFFSTGFLNFERESRHPVLKFKACLTLLSIL